jgi:hypothetical protein
MNTLIDAAIKNTFALGINSTFKIPDVKFTKMAKALRVRFTFGQKDDHRGTTNLPGIWTIYRLNSMTCPVLRRVTPAPQAGVSPRFNNF